MKRYVTNALVDEANAIKGNPYRSKDGKYTFGPYKTYGEPLKIAAKNSSTLLKVQQKLQDQADNMFWGSPEKLDKERELQIVKDKISRERKRLYESQGLEQSKTHQYLSDWTDGVGPRNSNGEYMIEPSLKKVIDTPEMKLERAFQQSVLHEQGVKELQVYRGQNSDKLPKGLQSWTTSKAVASTFGNKVYGKTVPVSKMVANNEIFLPGQYSESEIILDI